MWLPVTNSRRSSGLLFSAKPKNYVQTWQRVNRLLMVLMLNFLRLLMFGKVAFLAMQHESPASEITARSSTLE